jgi:hypothetical protein
MTRKHDDLPFKSRTQIREFSTLAVYDTYLRGAAGQIFRENVKLEPLEGYRKTAFFSNLGLKEDPGLGVTVFHNVRAKVHKDTVAFHPEADPHGAEMIYMTIHGVTQGYVEPLD